MADETPVVSMLEDWLICRNTRITGRFVVERVTDWRTGDQQGHAMDFVGATVMGRFTLWPGHLSAAGWPFADAEALDVPDGEDALLLGISAAVDRPFSTGG